MTPTQATAAKAPVTASQHANPRSDIEIAQVAKMRPIMDIAREKLGIAPENLPYGMLAGTQDGPTGSRRVR